MYPGAVTDEKTYSAHHVDTLRADYLGCYGKRDIHTPILDALAADGVRFGYNLVSLATSLLSPCSLMAG